MAGSLLDDDDESQVTWQRDGKEKELRRGLEVTPLDGSQTHRKWPQNPGLCVYEEVKPQTGPQGAKMRQSLILNKETAGCNRLHGLSVAPGVINALLIHTDI